MPPSQPPSAKRLEKYSLGIGDRFGRQGKAQLRAFVEARQLGVNVIPVWNKSNREHTLIGTEPASVLAEATDAVAAWQWEGGFHVDADHINLANVNRFIEVSDFFTIDVADFTGRAAAPEDWERFAVRHEHRSGELGVPGLGGPVLVDHASARSAARKFLWAIEEAGRIYRHIAERKGNTEFITEISIDETDTPQTPAELWLILAMIAQEGIPAQTVAPKFTGRFNKGVDYSGDLARFERELEADLCVTAFAAQQFGLPETLKLSVHSGSDKFSLYPIINRLVKKHGAGLHVKTAGTTWLEEVIGLAESGGDGLEMVAEIYRRAHPRFEELVKPYASVVEIDPSRLPLPAEVVRWDSTQFVATLRHDVDNPAYNRHFRQFLHVSFKVAAEMGDAYTNALETNEAVIARNVTENILRRHLLPIFG